MGIEDKVRDGEEIVQAGLAETSFNGYGAGGDQVEFDRATRTGKLGGGNGELDGSGWNHHTSYDGMR